MNIAVNTAAVITSRADCCPNFSNNRAYDDDPINLDFKYPVNRLCYCPSVSFI